jgi:hypothetical protein
VEEILRKASEQKADITRRLSEDFFLGEWYGDYENY